MNSLASNTVRKSYLLVTAIFGWFALILQFPLSVAVSRSKGMSPLGAVVTYFSFFTILTNLLVAIGIVCYLCIPSSTYGRFFGRATVQSGLALYIAVVGVVYSLLLREIWSPEGLQKVADVLLHDVVPVLYVLYWILFVSKTPLPWKSVLFWLCYPLVYLSYILIRGAFAGWYPYPFIDVGAAGYQRVFLNSVLLLVAFSTLGLVMVAFSRWMGGKVLGERVVEPGRRFTHGRKDVNVR